VFAEVVEPVGAAGDVYYSSGSVPASAGGCPSWFEVVDRDGWDGGHITVELDGCQVNPIYEYWKVEQNAGGGHDFDLDSDDIIVEWDEDTGHGSIESFSFTGTYVDVTNVTTDYVQVSRPVGDTRTNWSIYRMTSSGTLTVTPSGNEHEIFHLQRDLIDVFDKTDDVDSGSCVGPGDEVTYTICWDNTSDTTFEDAYIIDYLPDGVDYDYLISIMPYVTDPNYSIEDRTYTWELGTLAPDDSGCVSLTVTANDKAEPGMELNNVAELRTDSMLIATDFEDTPVCCWDEDDPNIIYVDMTATGNNNGISWTNAYSGEEGLQKALTRARKATCDVGLYTIYVATGIYNPGDFANSTFLIPEGAEVYGGFMSGGSDISERNPDTYETLLTGHRFIDTDPNEVFHYHIYNDTIVSMENLYVSDPNFPVNETSLLDGFTLNEATINGIYGTNVDFNIVNCTVADSGDYGIYSENADITIENCTVTDIAELDGIRVENGDVAVKWSKIKNSGWNGIYQVGEGNVIAVENSQITGNKRHGVLCENSTPMIKNCVVFGNGFGSSDYDGISITLPPETPVLYNNTIVYNAAAGIYCYDDTNSAGDPNHPDYPDIQNTILWYNNSGGDQITISLPQMPLEYERDDYAVYCGIQGCDDTKNNNIDEAPVFALAFDSSEPETVINPYHYHLAYDSLHLKDKGNPGHDTSDLGLYDIDGEDRLDNSRTDIGADELYSCDGDLTEDDIYNSLDWNFDGIVNNYEFAEFSVWWLAHDPNEPGYSPDPAEYAVWSSARDYNFDKIGISLYQIDVDDLMVIADDWLWIACWKQSQLDHFDSMVTAMATGSAESMMMVPMAMSSMSMAFEPMPEPEPTPNERSVAETVSFVEGIYGMIEHIDTSIEEGHENSENLYEVNDFLKDVLLDLQAERESAK